MADSVILGGMEYRTARITTPYRSLDELRAYMPANYRVVVTVYGPFIHGHDEAGWTLDGYVLPRLASGLIFAEEITPPESVAGVLNDSR